MHPLSFVAALLLLSSWLQPLHILPWVSWHSEVLAFVSVFLLALGLLGVRLWRAHGRSSHMVLPAPVLVWLALVVLVAVQWLSGLISFAGDALVLGLYFFLCALAWGLGHGQGAMDEEARARQRQAIEALAWTLVLGAFASAVIALVQTLEVWESASWINRMPQLRRPGGNLGQPNHLSTLLVMGLASLLFLYHLKRLGLFAAGSIFIVFSIGLAATESRTGLLSLVILSVWCLVGFGLSAFRMRPWVVLTGLALLVALFFAWPVLLSAAALVTADARLDTKAGSRLVVWPQLIEAIALRPWTGWGLREVSTAHNSVVDAYTVSEPFTYAHNLVLELALGMGVPLALLMLGVTGVWLWRRLKASTHIWAWYCVAAVLPVAVHSMLEFPFAYAYFLVPAMFLLGSLDALQRTRSVLRVSTSSVAVCTLLVTAVAGWSTVEYVRVEEDFRVARFEALNLGKTPPDHGRPEVFLMTQLDALLNAARIEPYAGMKAETVALAGKVAKRFPWPATQNRYALSLALNGQPNEARRQLQVMRTLHGEETYGEIRVSWQALAQERAPSLKGFTFP